MLEVLRQRDDRQTSEQPPMLESIGHTWWSGNRTGAVMTAHVERPALDVSRLEQFSSKVAGDQAVADSAVLVQLGHRLGRWRSLAALDTTTAAGLAEDPGPTADTSRRGCRRRPPTATSTLAVTMTVTMTPSPSRRRLRHSWPSPASVALSTPTTLIMEAHR
jgi:hypothetical protein